MSANYVFSINGDICVFACNTPSQSPNVKDFLKYFEPLVASLFNPYRALLSFQYSVSSFSLMLLIYIYHDEVALGGRQ